MWLSTRISCHICYAQPRIFSLVNVMVQVESWDWKQYVRLNCDEFVRSVRPDRFLFHFAEVWWFWNFGSGFWIWNCGLVKLKEEMKVKEMGWVICCISFLNFHWRMISRDKEINWQGWKGFSWWRLCKWEDYVVVHPFQSERMRRRGVGGKLRVKRRRWFLMQ